MLKAPQLDLESLMVQWTDHLFIRRDSIRLINIFTTSALWITNKERVVIQGSPWTWSTVRSCYCSFNKWDMNLSMLFYLRSNSGHIFTHTNVCVLQCWVKAWMLFCYQLIALYFSYSDTVILTYCSDRVHMILFLLFISFCYFESL